MTSCTRSVFIETTYACSLDPLSLERDGPRVGSAMRTRMAISKARMTCSMNVKPLEVIAITPASRLQPSNPYCTARRQRRSATTGTTVIIERRGVVGNWHRKQIHEGPTGHGFDTPGNELNGL